MKSFFKYKLLVFSFLIQASHSFSQNISEEENSIIDSTFILNLLEKNDLSNTETALQLAKEQHFENGAYLALQQLTKLYKANGDISFSLRYALEYLNLIDKKNAVSKKYNALCVVGNIYFEEKLFENALGYFNLANKLPLPTSQSKIDLWEKTGESYHRNEQLDSAMLFLKQAIDFYEKDQDIKGQIRNLKSIAEIYEEQNNCDKALEQNLKIQQLLLQNKDNSLIATATNNIGYNYHCLNDFENAIVNFKEAATLCELESCDIDFIKLQSNLSIAHFNIGDFQKGIYHLDKAIKAARSEKNFEKLAELIHLKATVFFRRKDWYQTQVYNNEAMSIAQEKNIPEVLQDSYQLAARIHQELYEFEPALAYYEKHLSLRDSLLLAERLRQQELLQQQFLLERSEKEIKLLLVNQEVQALNIRELEKQRSILKLQSEKLSLESKRKEDELSLLKQEQEIKEERLKTQELEAARSKQQLQLTRQQLEAAEKDRNIAELQQKEATQQQQIAEKEAEEKEREAEIKNLKNLQEIDRLQIEQQQTINQVFFGTGIGLLIVMGIILFSFLNARKKSRLLAKQNKEIEAQKTEIEKSHDLVEQERAKSEELLLNILPVETAKELKENGVATPKLYENVSVLFTDFVGFTRISEKMPPAQVIEELNTCFLAFDEIIERYDLEKIKTIGDAYMCAGGLPKKNDKNARDAVAAALEMQTFINQRYAEKTAINQPYWQMRVGIHTGNVVAGVVGSKKFAYDIWGDTVNLASRMESNGEPGKVNISDVTFKAVKNNFGCQFRGEIDVKNRGKVGMYFLENS